MANKDLISKKILKRLLVEFSTQLFGLNIIDAEPLDTEQPRIEGKPPIWLPALKTSKIKVTSCT